MNWLRGTRFRVPYVRVLALALLSVAAWAQTNPLQDRVRTQKLYRLNDVYEDSVLNLGGPSQSPDTLHYFRPAKWSTLVFSANGTFGTGDVSAVAWCGTQYTRGEYLLAPCDTLVLTSTGRKVWPLNIPACDAVMTVFSCGATIGTVTIDSTVLIENW